MRSFKKCSAIILSLALIAICFSGLGVSAETAKSGTASAAGRNGNSDRRDNV